MLLTRGRFYVYGCSPNRVNLSPKVCPSNGGSFSRRSFMGTELNFGSSFSRRNFLRGSALFVGAGAVGLEAFLAACNSTATTAGAATATVNSLPPLSNPGALYVFNQLVKQFESAYPGEKI